MKRPVVWLLTAGMLCSASAWAGFPAGRTMKGYLAQRSGEYAGAIEQYKAALKEDPESVELRLRLVRLFTVFGEVDQAIRTLDDGLVKRPGDPDLLLMKAKTLTMAGRSAEAADTAAEAAEKGGSGKAYGLAIRLLQGTGRPERALELAQKWVAAAPSDADAHSQYGYVLEMTNRVEEAEKSYRKALDLKPGNTQIMDALAGTLAGSGKRDEAIKLYRSVVEANPHEVDARLSLAELLMDAGQPQKARELLAESEKWVRGPALSYLRMGLLYLEVGDPEGALRVIESIPELERDERAWFFLGAARLGMEKFDQAIEAFERISPTSALYVEGLIRRSQALRESGRGEQAVSILKTWLAEHGEDLEATLALSALLQSLERQQEAADLLQAYLVARDPKDTRLYFALGAVYDKLGDSDKSIAFMRKVLELDPKHAHALNYIGYSYADRGINLDEAEKLTRQAVELLPDNGYILDSLGWVFFKQKRYAEARDTLEKALKMSADDPVIWEHLGDVYLALGDKAKAKEAYGKAIAIKPDTPGVKDKLDGLEGR